MQFESSPPVVTRSFSKKVEMEIRLGVHCPSTTSSSKTFLWIQKTSPLLILNFNTFLYFHRRKCLSLICNVTKLPSNAHVENNLLKMALLVPVVFVVAFVPFEESPTAYLSSWSWSMGSEESSSRESLSESLKIFPTFNFFLDQPSWHLPLRLLHRKSSHGCHRFRFFVFTLEGSHGWETDGVCKLLYARPMSHLDGDSLLKCFDCRWARWTWQLVVTDLGGLVS